MTRWIDYDDLEDVPADDWDAVVRRAGAPVFYRHAFIRALVSARVAPALETVYLLGRDEATGEPVAVCPASLQRPADPLHVLRGRFRGFDDDGAEQTTALLSHVWQCYDTRLPVTRPGLEPEVADRLREVAHGLGADVVGLVNVAPGPLAGVLAGRGFAVAPVDERFWADLRGVTGVDDWLSRLPRSGARNPRRYLRRAAERDVVVRRCPPSGIDLAEALDLVRETAARHNNAGSYPSGPFQALLRALGDLVEAIEIRDDGRLVAVGFCLIDENRYHMWTAGAQFDLDAPYSPYGLLFLESLRSAIEHGRPVLEGGRRNRQYKERLGLGRIPLVGALTAPAADRRRAGFRTGKAGSEAGSHG